jgi:hypothetical protein
MCLKTKIDWLEILSITVPFDIFFDKKNNFSDFSYPIYLPAFLHFVPKP